MLLREDDRGVLAIGQPSHAWLSGQLARAWGNDTFGQVEPFAEVVLAAEQHDVGWAGRDLEPIWNPETGRPRSFVEMPLDVHLRLWREGPRSLLSQSRYAALLVSMHGWRLYERRDLTKSPPAEADAIRTFLAGEQAFQRELIGLLQADVATAAAARDDVLDRNSLLIWTWDYLSLALCLGWASATAKGAPTVDGHVDMEVLPSPARRRVLIDPWPFQAPSLTVHCEGRRLAPEFGDEQEMRAAFTSAPWETLQLRLAPRAARTPGPASSSGGTRPPG
jgi:hypothetical protein